MPTYRTPGVYREDIFPAEPVELVTGVPVFLGLVGRAKLDALVPHLRREALKKAGVWLVRAGSDELEAGISGMYTLWPEFERSFGSLRQAGYLVRAVRGFFENGGSRCYIQLLAYDATVARPDALKEGLELLEALETVDLLCAPDLVFGEGDPQVPDPVEVRALQKMVLEHCDRTADRFAILDSLPGANLDSVLGQRKELTGTNGALYYPWVQPGEGGGEAGPFVPPCGHVAGVYARSDRVSGVHKAPANEILEGVLDLEVNVTASQQDGLNPEGVNCIRAFPGRGIRVWGARTLSRESEWIYVNVRRVFLTVGRWIERNFPWAPFEPNDSRLWSRIDRELSAYLTSLYQRGALQGRTAQEAFRVACDAATNPLEVREAGMVVTEIGLAFTAPAEFVVVRIIHGTSGVTVAAVPAAVAPGPVTAPIAGRAGRLDVRLTHIEYNPEGVDLAGEHVRIENQGTVRVDMSEWTLQDRAYNTFVFPAFSLRPGASVRVWTKEGVNTATDVYWGRGSAVWNNVGDTGYLRDREGRLVSTFSYTP